MPYVEYDEVEAICADCGRTFRSEEALAAHREESHAGHEELQTPAPAGEGTNCPTCHRRFSSVASLEAHVARAHRQG